MKKSILLTILVLGFTASFEIGLEFREYIKGHDSLLFGLRNPVVPENQSNPSTDNSNGATWGNADDPAFPFRSFYIKAEKQEKCKRVWLMSSSMTEDRYMSPHDIWPSILRVKLNGTGKETYQVMNAAKFGMTLKDG